MAAAIAVSDLETIVVTVGEAGPRGDPGSQGVQGPPGPPGTDGDDGEPGPPGVPGSPGSQGATGSPGLQGPMGPPGIDGLDGLDGDPGPPGVPGSPGSQGAPGSPGLQGSMGPPGIDGLDGLDGDPGPPGPPGSSPDAPGPVAIPQFIQSGTSPVERWYNGSMVNSIANTNMAYTRDILRAWPFFASEDITLDRIGAYVAAAVATSVFRLGIYTTTSRTNLYPDALVLDSGEFDGATTGLKSATISQTLTGGTLYWLVQLGGTANPNIRRPGLNNSFVIMGLDNTLSGAPGIGWEVSLSYTALPATFTASAVVLQTNTLFCPAYVRRSA